MCSCECMNLLDLNFYEIRTLFLIKLSVVKEIKIRKKEVCMNKELASVSSERHRNGIYI